MILNQNAHLSYCTNIHPGESWNEVFKSLQEFTISLPIVPETEAIAAILSLSSQPNLLVIKPPIE